MTTITWTNKQGTHTRSFPHSVARVFMVKLRTLGHTFTATQE
jgi:hypothetical protein